MGSEFAPQLADRDAHGVGERVGILVPDSLQQLFSADDGAVCLEQRLEHRQLLA
jgi:hypothetical protein